MLLKQREEIQKLKGVKFGREVKIQDQETQISFANDYNGGMPIKELMEKYELSKPSVIAMAKRLGLKPRHNRKVG